MPRQSRQRIASMFEERVKKFMEKMQFSDREGSAGFRIGDKQIDVGGGLDKTYVIVDCVTKIEKEGTKSLRSKIEVWRGNYSIFKEGLKDRENLRKYKEVRLVIATRNFRLRETDNSLAGNYPIVYIWDDQFFEYYENLHDKIGKYALYELKRELEIPSVEQTIEVPAIRIAGNNGVVFYLGTINPLELLEISYVARRERGDQRYYQRMINAGKLEQLAYYIHKSKKEFFNNVILAARDNTELSFSSFSDSSENEFGILKLNSYLSSLWIIDGQHRLYGFAHALKRFVKGSEENKLQVSSNWRIPFSIVTGINEYRQGELFMDINTTQTSLNADYIWDLRSVYGNDQQKLISNIAKDLNQIGCMKEMVYVPSTSVVRKKGVVSISKIARALEESKKMFLHDLHGENKNPLTAGNKGGMESHVVAAFIEASLDLVKSKNGEYFNFYLNGAGIQIFIRTIAEFLYYGTTLDNSKKYVMYLLEAMDQMSEFSTPGDIKTTLGNLGTRYSKNEFIEKCKREVNKRLDLNTENKLQRLPTTSVETIFAQAERNLRQFIYENLSSLDTKWYKSRLPNGAWDRLRPKQNEPVEKTWERADFSLCMQSIEMSGNWKAIFEPKLVKQGMYDNKEELMSHLTIIKGSRDPRQHLREQDRDVESAADKLAHTLIQRLKST